MNGGAITAVSSTAISVAINAAHDDDISVAINAVHDDDINVAINAVHDDDILYNNRICAHMITEHGYNHRVAQHIARLRRPPPPRSPPPPPPRRRRGAREDTARYEYPTTTGQGATQGLG